MSAQELCAGGPARVPAPRRLARHAVRLFRTIKERLDLAAENDLAIRELESLSDHMLRDMGVDRVDIRRRVRGPRDDD
ncbi:MAG: hypothetical protein Kow0026_03430 [Oricola sp.]